MMYVDLADHTAGFGHAADVYIRFDPLKFIDAEIETDGYHYVDLDLLRLGSAIAILCLFYDLWCEEQALVGNPGTARFEIALATGRLARFPDVEAVISEAMLRPEMAIDDPWFDTAVAPIYRKYVVSFFGRLASSDRNGR
ncbi:MAG: hypothetical protein Q8R02_02280 [Hyphomonadaceae bacterium]|nr:hypothetical protein [Hyphomonadaceae bacterium]